MPMDSWAGIETCQKYDTGVLYYIYICVVHRLTYDPQHVKFGSSTAAEDSGLTSAAKTRFAATLWN